MKDYVELNEIGRIILNFVRSDDYKRILDSMKHDTHEFEEGFLQGLVWSFITISQKASCVKGEERKHGKWLHLTLEPDDITGHTYGECSVCGKLRIVSNYCPNCGAEMDLEENK